jgi:hypothetical protein
MRVGMEEITCSEIVGRIHRTEFFLHKCKRDEPRYNHAGNVTFIYNVSYKYINFLVFCSTNTCQI